MLIGVLLRPVLHGVYGPLDEIIALLPVVIGTGLLIYLYFTSRKAKPHPDDPTQPPDDPSDL